MRSFKELAGITARGLAMGSADVVPGVSGGTIAFITGIYEELIKSIRAVNFHALKFLFAGKFRVFWEYINGSFLVALFLGVVIAIVSFSTLILHLLQTYPILVWSFFFGLIAASALVIGMGIKKWTFAAIVSFILGTGIAFFITIVSPSETPEAGWFIFLSGALAICAMILPGISGSFILLLLGKYEYIFTALKNFDFQVIGLFILGCITGILSFSHLLAWMFRHYKTVTVALLSGFMVGSLNKVWPWKVPAEVRMIKGEERVITERNLLPGAFENETGNPSLWMGAVVLFFIGFLLIWLLERYANKKQVVEA